MMKINKIIDLNIIIHIIIYIIYISLEKLNKNFNKDIL